MALGLYPVALDFYPMALFLDHDVLHCNDFNPMAEDKLSLVLSDFCPSFLSCLQTDQ